MLLFAGLISFGGAFVLFKTVGAVLRFVVFITALMMTGQAWAACTKPDGVGVEGEIVYNRAWKTMQFCDGDKWVGMGGGSDSVPRAIVTDLVCTSALSGVLRFNDIDRTIEFCDGNVWASVGYESRYPACAVAAIGQMCGQGVIYAGLSADGDKRMYTTPCDGGVTWSEATKTCTGARGNYAWSMGAVTSLAAPPMYNCTATVGSDIAISKTQGCFEGKAMTAYLASLGMSPSPAPYAAARYCDSLSYGGYDDWYLPSIDETNVLRDNYAVIGNFNMATGGWYWSSSSYSSTEGAWARQFSDDRQVNGVPTSSRHVRCVRRDN